ncbi:MAG: DMT family transporter [Hyphomicrobiales bacterium]|nr:DMT family transporter [Hyphomicrobiales bacterium]
MILGEQQRHNQRLGMSMTLIGGLLLTVDAPLLRLAQTDSWTIILIRGVFAFSAMLAFWVLFQRGRKGSSPFVNGYLSVFISCLTAIVSVMFVNAIQLTSVANVVFLMAFNPMFAALLSWLFLGERQSTATLLAILAAFGGVSIIVWDSVNIGNPLGDFLALGVSLTLAVILTIVRRSGTDQSMSPAFGSLMAAMAVIGFSSPGSLEVASWGWLALNGLIVIPLSSALLMLGPRYIAAPVVAMFFLLETVLTPVWMWLIFNEVPTVRSMIGGVVIVLALLAHSIWSLKSKGTAGFAGLQRQAAE